MRETTLSRSFKALLLILVAGLVALFAWQARAEQQNRACGAQAEQLAPLQDLLAAHYATRGHLMSTPPAEPTACGPALQGGLRHD